MRSTHRNGMLVWPPKAKEVSQFKAPGEKKKKRNGNGIGLFTEISATLSLRQGTATTSNFASTT
ncbi:Uncharacterized protein DAT39_001905, partial [Clarias magur]